MSRSEEGRGRGPRAWRIAWASPHPAPSLDMRGCSLAPAPWRGFSAVGPGPLSDDLGSAVDATVISQSWAGRAQLRPSRAGCGSLSKSCPPRGLQPLLRALRTWGACLLGSTGSSSARRCSWTSRGPGTTSWPWGAALGPTDRGGMLLLDSPCPWGQPGDSSGWGVSWRRKRQRVRMNSGGSWLSLQEPHFSRQRLPDQGNLPSKFSATSRTGSTWRRPQPTLAPTGSLAWPQPPTLAWASLWGARLRPACPAPPSRVCSCAKGKEVARAAGAGPGRVYTWTHVSSELSHTLAGWHMQTRSHHGPLCPARAHRLPCTCVKAGTPLHTRTDTSVCSEEVSWALSAKLCTQSWESGPEDRAGEGWWGRGRGCSGSWGVSLTPTAYPSLDETWVFRPRGWHL